MSKLRKYSKIINGEHNHVHDFIIYILYTKLYNSYPRGGGDTNVYIVLKGGEPNVYVCLQGGREGSKMGQNLSTWFMEAP